MRIPPGYREPLTQPSLGRRVEALWTFRATEPGRSTILPDGRCDLIVRRRAGQELVPVLTGPATRPYTVTFGPGDVWVGIRMSPCHGGLLWEGAPPVDVVLRGQEATSRLVVLSEVLGRGTLEEVLEGLLGISKRHARPCPSLVQRLVDAVHVSGGRLSVDQLGRLVGCTPRHIARLFRRWNGLSPKVYGRLVRLHRTLRLLKRGAATLSEIALEAGFSDQAHMTRDLRELSGWTPTSIPPDAAQPGFFA